MPTFLETSPLVEYSQIHPNYGLLSSRHSSDVENVNPTESRQLVSQRKPDNLQFHASLSIAFRQNNSLKIPGFRSATTLETLNDNVLISGGKSNGNISLLNTVCSTISSNGTMKSRSESGLSENSANHSSLLSLHQNEHLREGLEELFSLRRIAAHWSDEARKQLVTNYEKEALLQAKKSKRRSFLSKTANRGNVAFDDENLTQVIEFEEDSREKLYQFEGIRRQVDFNQVDEDGIVFDNYLSGDFDFVNWYEGEGLDRDEVVLENPRPLYYYELDIVGESLKHLNWLVKMDRIREERTRKEMEKAKGKRKLDLNGRDEKVLTWNLYRT